MKRYIFIPLLLISIIAYTFYSCRQKQQPEKAIAQTLIAQVDSFITAKNTLLAAVKNGAGEKQLQALFLDTRMAYKKFEWAAEYFSPAGSRFINGPPVQEVEMTDGQVFEPAGLQVIETYLFPKYDIAQKKELIRQLNLMQQGCNDYKSHFTNVDIFDWQVFDAAKLEVFRVLTLGITGFDDPLSLKAMDESAAGLESLKAAMAYYQNDGDPDKITGQLNAAISYLRSHTNFNGFDRAAFITQYGNGITVGISNLEHRLNIHVMHYNRLLNQDAKTLFDVNAFNINAYKPYEDADVTDKKVALGRVLFADPMLSGTGTRSCQSCHQPEKAFTDGLVKNTMITSAKLLRRNTPTLINAALQPSQFYDLRVASLEDQSNSVVQNVQEMHGSMKLAVNRPWQNKGYRELFNAAYPQKNRTAIDTMEVMNALGSYVRSLSALNSRFDQYMRGNKTAMNQDELTGFNLFMGKAKCGTCHYMPLFNGTFPPRYIKIESEVIGVPRLRTEKVIDDDMGRYEILKVAAFKHAFKTMTVRNAARTAPYMHNGVFTTLEQVVDFYNKGGGVGMGIKVDNQTLPFDKLDLTNKESGQIVAFIKSLNNQ